jgi:hypothetical protein
LLRKGAVTLVGTASTRQTSEQRARLLAFCAEQYVAGRSIHELAELTGRSQSAVRRPWTKPEYVDAAVALQRWLSVSDPRRRQIREPTLPPCLDSGPDGPSPDGEDSRHDLGVRSSTE